MFRKWHILSCSEQQAEEIKKKLSTTIQILYSGVYQITDIATTVQKNISKLSQGA